MKKRLQKKLSARKDTDLVSIKITRAQYDSLKKACDILKTWGAQCDPSWLLSEFVLNDDTENHLEMYVLGAEGHGERDQKQEEIGPLHKHWAEMFLENRQTA